MESSTCDTDMEDHCYQHKKAKGKGGCREDKMEEEDDEDEGDEMDEMDDEDDESEGDEMEDEEDEDDDFQGDEVESKEQMGGSHSSPAQVGRLDHTHCCRPNSYNRADRV